MGLQLKEVLKIAKVNIIHQFLPHLVLMGLVMLLSPFLYGTKNLIGFQTAKIYEMYLSILGVIAITPIMHIEQNKDMIHLLNTKKIRLITVWGIRFFYSVLLLTGILLLYGLYLKTGNCEISYKLIGGGLATAFCLGSMGMLSFSIFNNIPVSYMIPMIYFILSMGMGEKLGLLFLFSMTKGSYEPKPVLLVIGIVLAAAAFVISNRKIGRE